MITSLSCLPPAQGEEGIDGSASIWCVHLLDFADRETCCYNVCDPHPTQGKPFAILYLNGHFQFLAHKSAPLAQVAAEDQVTGRAGIPSQRDQGYREDKRAHKDQGWALRQQTDEGSHGR